MRYEHQEIAKFLKAARESKGLSQRALAERSGVLQTQISRIENGAADFRVSTLVALAHALGLDLTLVPRKAVPAVQAVIRASDSPAVPQSPIRRALDEVRALRNTLAHTAGSLPGSDAIKPAYTLDDEDEHG